MESFSLIFSVIAKNADKEQKEVSCRSKGNAPQKLADKGNQ